MKIKTYFHTNESRLPHIKAFERIIDMALQHKYRNRLDDRNAGQVLHCLKAYCIMTGLEYSEWTPSGLIITLDQDVLFEVLGSHRTQAKQSKYSGTQWKHVKIFCLNDFFNFIDLNYDRN